MATASGAGSTATSGNATSAAISVQKQRIKQKAANQVAKVPCDCGLQLPWTPGTAGEVTTNTNSNTQTGAQSATQAQASAAATLDALASGVDSVATSGEATSLADNIQKQIIKQFGLNQGLFAETPAP
jgi:spore germination protein YaaH